MSRDSPTYPGGDGKQGPQSAQKGCLFRGPPAENDVLLGRGQPITNNQGNIRLRQLVVTRHLDYMQAKRQKDKHQVAVQILEEIHKRGGRFLRKCSDKVAENSGNNNPRRLQPSSMSGEDANHDITLFVVIDDEKEILVKIKQLLRDMGPEAMSRRLERRRYRYRKLGTPKGLKKGVETTKEDSSVSSDEGPKKKNVDETSSVEAKRSSNGDEMEKVLSPMATEQSTILPRPASPTATAMASAIQLGHVDSNDALNASHNGHALINTPGDMLLMLRAQELARNGFLLPGVALHSNAFQQPTSPYLLGFMASPWTVSTPLAPMGWQSISDIPLNHQSNVSTKTNFAWPIGSTINPGHSVYSTDGRSDAIQALALTRETSNLARENPTNNGNGTDTTVPASLPVSVASNRTPRNKNTNETAYKQT